NETRNFCISTAIQSTYPGARSEFEGVALMGVASSMDGSRVVFAHSRVMQWAQTLSYFMLLLRVAEERLPDSWVRSRVARTHFMLQPDLSHRR
ncbi:hypothetical protein, partial [Deinococcus daejeonensis]|uniref:hypothetical protein n=1 Tax=Deinococcus daejeonensis TaxID=1007098 RepID=UPI001E3143BF